MSIARRSFLTLAVTFLAADLGASVARAERPRDVLHFMRPPLEQRATGAMADSHIIYLNPCLPNGCKVTVGNTDSRVDTSDIASQNGTLSAFSYGTDTWNQTVACVRNVFSRFNVTITDVDPGMTPHYEVMVAGTADQIMGNQGAGIGGVADFPCQDVGNCDPYLPNALVFDFADSFGADPNELCAVAAQEIAHTWALDHVVDATDPLTYNNYNGVRQYHDHEACGSDCQGGKSPFGLTCSGSGGKATHACSGNNQPTQDEVATITTLFGASGPPTPPTVKITSPEDGAPVTAGFAVTATITDDVGVSKAELYIDGSLIGTVSKAPFKWTTAATLAPGSHVVKVTGYDLSDTPASASVTVTVGGGCTDPSMCPNATDACVDGRCVPGEGTPGGLGTVCTKDADCASMICAADSAGTKYCTENCDPAKNACGSGFSCVSTGTGGVCWPGGNDGGGGGGGGCDAGGGGTGATLLGLGFAALLFGGRRRRTR